MTPGLGVMAPAANKRTAFSSDSACGCGSAVLRCLPAHLPPSAHHRVRLRGCEVFAFLASFGSREPRRKLRTYATALGAPRWWRIPTNACIVLVRWSMSPRLTLTEGFSHGCG